VNSMRSWKRSGLLDMMFHNRIILNGGVDVERAIALDHGFEIVEPKDIPNGKVHLCFFLIERQTTGKYE
jgi:hypothetical protein